VGTWTTSDAGGQGGCTYTTWTDIDVSCDGVESTLGDEAHTSGQVPPMRAQQAHVKVTSPAKAHRVKTSTMAKHDGRLRMESAVPFPYDTRAEHMLGRENTAPYVRYSHPYHRNMILSSCPLRKGTIDPWTPGMKPIRDDGLFFGAGW
jgi:hypothetical protein